MEITDIVVQQKDKSRCSIYLDGRFFCGLKNETAALYRLKKGTQISEEELSSIQAESEKLTALDRALSYLSRSMKTEKQVRDYLSSKGYVEGVIEFVVEKLKGYRYLSDEDYSLAYVKSEGKKKGKRRLKAELLGKGISKEEIERALETIEDEGTSAKEVLSKYLRGKTLDEENYRKAYSYLLRRGFDYDTARSALRAFGEEE